MYARRKRIWIDASVVRHNVMNYSSLSDMDFSRSIDLADYVVKLKKGIRFIYEG